MTYLEFKQRAEELGFTISINKSYQDKADDQFNRVNVYLSNDETSIVIAKIFEDEWPTWWFAHDAVEGMEIEDLINEFSNTPINERGYEELDR